MLLLRSFLLFLLTCATALGADLPRGVSPVWDLEKAYREDTPSTERICLNGLWNWQPATNQTNPITPSAEWGWFKVPGPWPGITDYMQKDCQTLYPDPAWKSINLGSITAAWHQREIQIPDSWRGRRVTLQTEYLNSFATVFLDGQKAGEIRFPAGEVDLTPLAKPGQKQTLSILVVAMPLKGVLLSYTDSASAREVKGSVPRRGLCGDVFLRAARDTPRIETLKIGTSFRNSEITFAAALENLSPNKQFRLRAQIKEGDREITNFLSASFPSTNQFTFTHSWKPTQLWDIHTPTNQFEATISLLSDNNERLDSTTPKNFGFREFWIDGRDFYLNGSRIFLSAVPLDNAEVSVASATYEAARESLLRLKSFGINFVYTHNYGCEPGSHLSFNEILRAADDVGMLVALSQPHFSHYDWKGADADATNGYATHARFYTQVAGNHPSVVFYSMSHNATGYDEDMNPDMIDGLHDPRDQWASNNAKLALRAEAIVRHLDPARIVYHHASGNLGVMHDMNFYPNFVPIQELSDWFGHWSTNGVKPVFMCEYGAPFTWDWTMYRGWYKGQREFGSARVPWEFCLAEWNAQFIGDRAFQISDAEKNNLRWEAAQFRAGNLWHRWDYPTAVGSSRFDETYPIHAAYLTDNFRSFRAWGVSGISPWEHEHFWKLRDGVENSRQDFPTDWQNLQRPGYSPDYLAQRYERFDLAFERSDWIPTEAAQSLLRNNQPLLAYIAGKPEAFTSKDHIFQPGEQFEKQLILINNSRELITANCEWSLEKMTGTSETKIETGNQSRIPLQISLPATFAPGSYDLKATVHFSNNETQTDTFTITIIAPPRYGVPPLGSPRIALYDPKGETTALLHSEKIPFDLITDLSSSTLSSNDVLIIGKSALTPDGPAPDISNVRTGLKVLIFEQTSATLEKRFGFRVEEYGLRNVFPRVTDHPILHGLTTETLHDWRGSSTLLPPQLTYTTRPRYGPTVQWCDIPVPHLWRCGNRGNVASVLIEKPTRGNFLPIIDGGFDLQYSPLLEYHEGNGVIIFCQLDVTARTEADPAATSLVHNLLNYISGGTSSASPVPREVFYTGDPAGQKFLESIGIATTEKPTTNTLLVIGPHSSYGVPPLGGLPTLALGLTESEANQLLPIKIHTRPSEHISAFFDPPPLNSPFAGLNPADLHNRDPRKILLILDGRAPASPLTNEVTTLANGTLASTGNITFCQLVPWQFEGSQPNLRRTERRLTFLLSRLLSNLGATPATPLIDRFHNPPIPREKRFLTGLYLDTPEEWDDPYRHFRW